MAFDLLSKKQSGRDWSVSVGGDEVGLTLSWASAKGQLDSLKAAVDILNADVSGWYHKSAKESEQKQFANTWSMWRDQFYKWYKTAISRSSTLTPEMPWSVAEAVEKKTSELNGWRRQFERLSGEMASGPGPVVPSGSGIWKWVAVAGAGGLVTLLVARRLQG